MEIEHETALKVKEAIKSDEKPMWPILIVLIANAYVALFHMDVLGAKSIIIIEILFACLIAVLIISKRKQKELIELIKTLTKH